MPGASCGRKSVDERPLAAVRSAPATVVVPILVGAMMTPEYHPDWCSRTACTAYLEDGDELHRSEPIVIKTDDPGVALFIAKTANRSGTGACIEIAKLSVPTTQPWHLSEPVDGTELVLPTQTASAMMRAAATLA
jgi:hypothetical protein